MNVYVVMNKEDNKIEKVFLTAKKADDYCANEHRENGTWPPLDWYECEAE